MMLLIATGLCVSVSSCEGKILRAACCGMHNTEDRDSVAQQWVRAADMILTCGLGTLAPEEDVKQCDELDFGLVRERATGSYILLGRLGACTTE